MNICLCNIYLFNIFILTSFIICQYFKCYELVSCFKRHMGVQYPFNLNTLCKRYLKTPLKNKIHLKFYQILSDIIEKDNRHIVRFIK